MVTTEVTNPLITQTQNYLRAVRKIQSLKAQLKAKDAEIERLQAQIFDLQATGLEALRGSASGV